MKLETIRRQSIRRLMAIMNDGGYGAEVDNFRANGITAKEAMHGCGDLAIPATAPTSVACGMRISTI